MSLLPNSLSSGKIKPIALLIGIAIMQTTVFPADEGKTLMPEIGPGTLALDARLRFEFVDVDDRSSDIDALGLRTRLGYSWDWGNDVNSLVEIEDLRFADSDNRPALDVPTTEVNQAWIEANGLKLGRQVYTLDDHRFIGHVGWRQNIQSFDAVTGAYSLDSETKLNLAYLNSVRRVNATSQDLNGLLLNGSRDLSDSFNLTGFAYLLDFDNPVLTSSDTLGIRAVGSIDYGEEKLGYTFSYARQSDNSGSVSNFDLDYLAGELSATSNGMTFRLGAEVLEGDGTTGFTTPLATVHKFNGFADQFAGASLGLGRGLNQGLKDFYGSFSFTVPDIEVPITIAYHHFETENVSDFLGTEWDLVGTYKLNDHAQLLSKIAYFDSDGQENVVYGGSDNTLFTLEVNLKY